LAAVVIAPFIGIIGAKSYQFRDVHSDRGAIGIKDGAFGESYSRPEYLDQGWDANDSLWFYNTTQGSALLPYDFFLALEQPGLKKVTCKRNDGKKKVAWFLCDLNIDRFRYLPQKKSIFNPDALPVGFVKETYQGKDYVGHTCAACHTGQVNFKGRALRIDGGPAMADMIGFLTELSRSMKLTRGLRGGKNRRLDRFVKQVLALNNDYSVRAQVIWDLEKWGNVLSLYNSVNDPIYFKIDKDTKKATRYEIAYGYARLDAFGRIYNRVIQHAINRDQVAAELALVMDVSGKKPLLTNAQINTVINGDGTYGAPIGKLILRDGDFARIVNRLQSDAPGYPNLDPEGLRLVRHKIFNAPNAPVSYPFLWDITHSDYVQWNGLANNSGGGPLGRNAGEVTGVFGILDWQKDTRWLTRLFGGSLSAVLSGQKIKREQIYFKSSVDLFNLQRLESHLGSLTSPRWPFCKENGRDGNYYLPETPKLIRVDERECRSRDSRIDKDSRDRGWLIYAKQCQSCHVVIQRDAWDRLMVSSMSKIAKSRTDPTMAKNSVNYSGKSGNMKNTYQNVGVGRLVIKEDAPVVQILTATTAGVVGTPDADKWFPRRIVEYVYTLAMSIFDNQIKDSIKNGKYDPDTTAEPYKSLLSYRARSLNGIWATAPYLHNGSVPTLFDLLSPVKCKKEPVGGNYRPKRFTVGEREFDPKKVGFVYKALEENEELAKEDKRFIFDTSIPGNANTGHDYGACTRTDDDRRDLIEFLKSL
jgi:hypothetical protein